MKILLPFLSWLIIIQLLIAPLVLPQPAHAQVGFVTGVAGTLCAAAAAAVRDTLIGYAEIAYSEALELLNQAYALGLAQILKVRIAAIREPLKLVLRLAYKTAQSALKGAYDSASQKAWAEFRDKVTNKCPKGDTTNCLAAALACPSEEKLYWDFIEKKCACSTDILPPANQSSTPYQSSASLLPPR